MLADALDTLYAFDKDTVAPARFYASVLADQDTRDARHEGMRQEMVQLAAAFGAEASYSRPKCLGFQRDWSTSILPLSRG